MSFDSSAALRAGLDQIQWTASDLWVGALGIGGGFAQGDVQGMADGTRPATPMEHDILAAAINGYLIDRGQGHHVPYWTGA